MNARLGIGSDREVRDARKALQTALSAAEQAKLNAECMLKALPSVKAEISGRLRVVNDEVSTRLRAENRAAYEAALQQFDQDVSAHRIQRDDFGPRVMQIFDLAAKVGMVNKFREHLRDHQGALPSGFHIP